MIWIFIMKKLDYSLPAFILAFVLCPIIEENLRRTLLVSDGSYAVFFTRPVSLVLIMILLLIVGYMFYPTVKKLLKKNEENKHIDIDPVNE